VVSNGDNGDEAYRKVDRHRQPKRQPSNKIGNVRRKVNKELGCAVLAVITMAGLADAFFTVRGWL